MKHYEFDKVFAVRTLLTAYQQVMKRDGAAGVDQCSPDDFARRLPDSVRIFSLFWELSDMIKEGRFTPQAIKRVEIPKPGTNETRPLGIRMRLRSILRKRQKKRGKSCNHHDHKQWPYKFFADLGLFSLKSAWEVAVPSSRR